MKKNERLLDILGQVDDELIASAAPGEVNKRRISYKKCIIIAAAVAMIAALGIGAWHFGNEANVPPEQTLSDTRWPVKTVEGTKVATPSEEVLDGDPPTGAMPDGDNVPDSKVEETHEESQNTEDTGSGESSEVVTQKETVTGSAVDTAVDTSNEDGEEIAIVPKWDEKTLTQKFPAVEYNGSSYSTRNSKVGSAKLGDFLGETTVIGQDIYTSEMYTAKVRMYEMKKISSECTIALEFEGYEGYYTYNNSDYRPETLGDMIDDLNLLGEMNFGSVWYSYHGDLVEFENVDDALIWDMLLSDTDIAEAKLPDTVITISKMSVSVNIPLLGYKNISLAVTEDGYLTTNILNTRKAFFIGTEKVDEFVNYIVDNCDGYIIRYNDAVVEETTRHDLLETEYEIEVYETTPAYNPETYVME